VNITEQQWTRICRTLGFTENTTPLRVAQEIEVLKRTLDQARVNLGRDRDDVRAVLRGALEKL
jgi:hypothetical protein